MQKGRDRDPSASSSRSKAFRNDVIERLAAPHRRLFSQPRTEVYVEAILLLHRSRAAVFRSHLFSDPAWDLLLQLYAAELDHRDCSLSELIEAVAMPKSVVARWITALVDAGLVVSNGNPQKADCLSISITPDAAARMERLIAQWAYALPTR